MKIEKNSDICIPGSPLCPGCGALIAFRHALNTLGKNTVLVIVPGCMAPMGATFDLQSGVKLPALLGLLENPAAPACGIKAGLDFKGIEMNVLAFIGDGGTTDLGLTGVLAAAERKDPIIYICYDNEGFMNTGIQRSSSTTYGAWTSNTPKGKDEWRKNMPLIVYNSGASYVATASVSHLTDYIRKVKKAEEITKNDEGMAYIHVLCPCPTGWRFQSNETIKVGNLAVQTRIWNLYEIYKKTLRFTYTQKEIIPIQRYLSIQGRFRNLTKSQVDTIQRLVDEEHTYLKHIASLI